MPQLCIESSLLSIDERCENIIPSLFAVDKGKAFVAGSHSCWNFVLILFLGNSVLIYYLRQFQENL